MKTDLDELLKQHANRWTEAQPPPPSLVTAVKHSSHASTSRLRYLAIAACVVAVLAVAAIPLARTLGNADHAGRPGAATGTVTGQYRVIGGPGPTPSIDRSLTGTIWAYPGHVELSKIDQTRPAGHVDTDSAGNFTLSLQPGDYTLFATADSSPTADNTGCGATVFVRIVASASTTANLVCAVP